MTCALASKDCAGRLEWHHVIKQQRLRREFKHGAWWSEVGYQWRPRVRTDTDEYLRSVGLRTFKSLEAILGDTRNRVFLCEGHFDRRFELPQVQEFCREFGLREDPVPTRPDPGDPES